MKILKCLSPDAYFWVQIRRIRKELYTCNFFETEMAYFYVLPKNGISLTYLQQIYNNESRSSSSEAQWSLEQLHYWSLEPVLD